MSAQVRKVRLVPFFIVAAAALAVLKAAGLWVSFSSAGAAENEMASGAAVLSDAPPPQISESETSIRLSGELAERKRLLDAREAQLDTREQLLAAAETKLAVEFNRLGEEREALSAVRARNAQSQQEEIEALSNAYERMKARDAARIFEVLDDDILVPVAAGMRTQSLAAVLGEMSAERAKALTKALANLPKSHDPS